MNSLPSKGCVIFVDDEQEVRISSTQTLELEGFEVIAFARAPGALEHLSATWPGVIVTDLRMPKMDGLTLLEKQSVIILNQQSGSEIRNVIVILFKK